MSSSVSFDLPASMQSITSEDPLTSGKRVGPSKPSEMNNADFRQEDKQQREKKNLEAIWRIKSLYWIKLILTTQLHCWPIEGISGHSVVQTDQARIAPAAAAWPRQAKSVPSVSAAARDHAVQFQVGSSPGCQCHDQCAGGDSESDTVVRWQLPVLQFHHGKLDSRGLSPSMPSSSALLRCLRRRGAQNARGSEPGAHATDAAVLASSRIAIQS
jgi:hypothetical protein